MTTILIVDDDTALRERLARAFAERGFEVVQAADHAAAIAVAHERPIDRAVVDLRMPGPGGLVVVQELHALQPAMQVVVVTGYGSIATAVEAMRLGARDYLTKPAHADQILAAFDGIMVARGDLGVEIPLERVPRVQKQLIAAARAAGKPVITATDMLDSMRANPRPTRAEASDVANAVYDGTDAVMLSGETAVGQYPVEAVAYMGRIVCEAEADRGGTAQCELSTPRGGVEDHTAHLACTLAREVNAQAIVAPTRSGRTPRLVARHRPETPLIAPSAHAPTRRQLALVWGVQPVPLDGPRGTEDRLEAAVRAAYEHGAVQPGDRVVVLAGHPIEGGVSYPTIRVVRVGAGGESGEP